MQACVRHEAQCSEVRRSTRHYPVPSKKGTAAYAEAGENAATLLLALSCASPDDLSLFKTLAQCTCTLAISLECYL